MIEEEETLESRIADLAANDPEDIDLPVAWKMIQTWAEGHLGPLAGQDGTAELWQALEVVQEVVELRLQDKYGYGVKELDERLLKRLNGDEDGDE